MNDATPTRSKCHPAVRLSYDTSKIEGTLRAFGSLEQGARSAVNAIYQISLKNIHIRAQDHVYSASEQCGDFLVKFTITSNLFSATIIEYNPGGDPTGIFDGVTIKVPKGGHPVVVTSSPLTRTVSFLSPNSDDKKGVVFPIEPIVAAAVFTCEPPDGANSSGHIVIDLDQHLAVSVSEFKRSSYDSEMACASDHKETELAEINAYHESLSGMEAYMIHKNWAELIKPILFEIKPGNDPLLQETIIAEPLERGFGLTLGNALRRVLLASLHGPEYDTKISRHRNDGTLNFGVHDSPDYGCINDLICGGDGGSTLSGGAGYFLADGSTLSGGAGYFLTGGGTISDDAVYFLADGSTLSGGAGYFLTGGGTISDGAVYFLADGSTLSGGAGYFLTGGGTISDDAVYFLTGGGDGDTFVNCTRGCNPQQFDLAGKCGRSISLFDQLHYRDWTASGKRSGTNRQELFPRSDHVMYIEHIDDSMYSMYITSRSTGLGQFGEMPRQAPHGS